MGEHGTEGRFSDLTCSFMLMVGCDNPAVLSQPRLFQYSVFNEHR